MDIQPQVTQPISDDQELAKALAGVNGEMANGIKLEGDLAKPNSPEEKDKSPEAGASLSTPSITYYNKPVAESAKTNTIGAMNSSDKKESLDDIKKDVLVELRPLVEKLDLEPEEKFDIYLLLLRSTDDTTLIAAAHEAARGIVDETKRAQALLDILKEIDYFSAPEPAAEA
jgi:hypothetical protein